MDNTPTSTPLPNWLVPTPNSVTDPMDNPSTSLSDEAQREQRANRLAVRDVQFAGLFERAIDRLMMGQPLSSSVELDPRQPEYGHFIGWIHKDADRKRRYLEAQEIGAEVVANQLLEIADAEDSIEDVARSTLRINTRKWLLGVWNRKRFGETKQIEQNVTIDLGGAMEEARRRVEMRTIDATARLIGGDE